MYNDELEELENGIIKLNYSLDDFLINGELFTLIYKDSQKIGALQGIIKITRKSTNISNDYDTSHKYIWVKKCLGDIKGGIFGP